MKNIVLLSDSSKAHYGGGDRVSLKSIEALQAYRLYAVDYAKSSRYIFLAKEKVSAILTLKGYGKISKGEKSSFSIGFLETLLYPFFLVINVLQCLYFFKKHGLKKKQTMLYATTKKQLILVYLLRNFGYRYIFHAHSFDDKKNVFYRLIETPQKKASCILCVSKFVQQNINLPHNTQLLYNPIEFPYQVTPSSFDDKILSKDKVIASFSTLIHLKGVAYFMKSYRFLQSQSTAIYQIFGEGVQKYELKKWERKNVKLQGFCNDIASVLQEIYLVVVPSIAPESFGLTILEANAFGIPVITTDIGAQAELVRDGYNGFLVPPKDEKSIAEKIDILITNPSLYREMSQNARTHAQHFSFDRYREKLVATFENCFKQLE